MLKLRIVCARPGYRLAGIAHPALAFYDPKDITEDQATILRDDPLKLLTIDVVDGEGVILPVEGVGSASGIAADFLAGVDPRVVSAAASNYGEALPVVPGTPLPNALVPTPGTPEAIPVPGMPGVEQVVVPARPELPPAVSAALSAEASVGTAPASPGAVPAAVVAPVPGGVVGGVAEVPASVTAPAAAVPATTAPGARPQRGPRPAAS